MTWSEIREKAKQLPADEDGNSELDSRSNSLESEALLGDTDLKSDEAAQAEEALPLESDEGVAPPAEGATDPAASQDEDDVMIVGVSTSNRFEDMTVDELQARFEETSSRLRRAKYLTCRQ